MRKLNDIHEVVISNIAIKHLKPMPSYIKEKLYKWVEQIKLLGLSEVRKIKGYHDEQLKGDRFGQRSIRLNKAYRAIYVIKENEIIDFVSIIEVNKHDY